MDGKGLLWIVVAIVACVLLTGIIGGNLAAPDKIDPEKESIEMVQPCGWIFCGDYDQQYAEHVNLPNSEANRNNAEANRVNAQATKIVSEVRNEAYRGDFQFGTCIGSVLTIFFVMGGILVIAALAKH